MILLPLYNDIARKGIFQVSPQFSPWRNLTENPYPIMSLTILDAFIGRKQSSLLK
jgi:hypothetical protein